MPLITNLSRATTARVRPHRPFDDSRRKAAPTMYCAASECTDTANEHPLHGLFKTGTHTRSVCLSKSESQVQSPKNDAPLMPIPPTFPFNTARISNYLNLLKRNLLKLCKATKLLLFFPLVITYIFYFTYICRYNKFYRKNIEISILQSCNRK